MTTLVQPFSLVGRAPLSVPPVLADLEEVERLLARSLSASRPSVAQMLQHLSHYRGKRLRPLLLLLTAQACGQIVPAHHTLAVVVEMIHTATLVHDDVLDEADVRRHVRTVHALWGNKRSILLGDWLFTHAFHLTSTLGDARTCEIIGEATNRVCFGEMLQTAERGNLELSEEEYFQMIEGKTAALTECCARLGAMHAGADERRVEALAEYGRCLGMAFQIADDLLDLIGDENKAGKTLGTDLQQGKLTLPLVRMLDGVPADEAARLRQILTDDLPHKRARIAPALEATHALSYARRRAEEFASRARSCLTELAESSAKTWLILLTEWAIRREQ